MCTYTYVNMYVHVYIYTYMYTYIRYRASGHEWACPQVLCLSL